MKTLITLLSLFLLSGCDNAYYREENTKTDAFVTSQDVVRQQLDIPDAGEFPNMHDSFISHHGNTYNVQAYVDVPNKYGGTERHPYTCVMHYGGANKDNPSNTDWEMVDCFIK